jgi:hypothetical protein
MKLASTLLTLELVLCIRGSVGVLRIHHENGHQETFDTATFVYYGPQNPEVHQVQMLWLHPDEFCMADLNTTGMRGRFVITRGVFIGCDINEAYTRLEKAGAAALAVQTFTATPGIYSFAKADWVGRPTGKMPFVDVQAHFDTEGCSIRLDSCWNWVDLEEPHNRQYQDTFTSWTWTLVLRVGIPMVSFYSALLGAKTVYTRRHVRVSRSSKTTRSRRRPIGFTIGLIEMVTSMTITVNFALGHTGPMLMPFRCHVAFFLLFSGSSLFSMVLLALLAREKTRTLNNLIERDVWVEYFWTLFFCGLIFVGCDVLNIMFFVFNIDAESTLALLVLSIPFIIAGQIVVGLYFFYQVIYIFLRQDKDALF